ncbi:MAG: cytochrome c [Steroidobacteraceae bacterium]
MTSVFSHRAHLALLALTSAALCYGGSVLAQQASAPAANTAASGAGSSPAESAIAYRKAVFTVIGGNFGSIGGVLQGRSDFDANVKKRAERTAYLATLVADAFPDVSRTGNTRARPEVWSDQAGFAKATQDLVDASNALVAVLNKDNSNSAAFKEAAGRVGQACKGCHDAYRTR